jgi:hypothetical protein
MKMDFEEYRNASKRPREEPRRVVRKSYDTQAYDKPQSQGETNQ